MLILRRHEAFFELSKFYGTHVYLLTVIIASFPGPLLFRLHEGKSQGLVSKVT